MLSVVDNASLSGAVSSQLDARIVGLLETRRQQLGADFSELAKFVVIEPGDSLVSLEREMGFCVFQNPVTGHSFGDTGFSPAWEWLADHGYCFELVFILDDSGFAHVLLIPKISGISSKLLRMCEAYAEVPPSR